MREGGREGEPPEGETTVGGKGEAFLRSLGLRATLGGEGAGPPFPKERENERGRVSEGKILTFYIYRDDGLWRRTL